MAAEHERIIDLIRQRNQAREELARIKHGNAEAARNAYMAEREAAAIRDRDRARLAVLEQIAQESGIDAAKSAAVERGWTDVMPEEWRDA